MYRGHDQYWQIAYQKFLVSQNCIKKDLEISFYFRKLSRFWLKCFCTALEIDNFSVKYCSVLARAVLENLPQNRDILSYVYIYICLDPFYAILSDQKLLIRIFLSHILKLFKYLQIIFSHQVYRKPCLIIL